MFLLELSNTQPFTAWTHTIMYWYSSCLFCHSMVSHGANIITVVLVTVSVLWFFQLFNTLIEKKLQWGPKVCCTWFCFGYACLWTTSHLFYFIFQSSGSTTLAFFSQTFFTIISVLGEELSVSPLSCSDVQHCCYCQVYLELLQCGHYHQIHLLTMSSPIH